MKLINWIPLGGLHGGVVVSTVASQQEGSRFDRHLGPFCVSLHVLFVYAWVLSGYSGFLPPSKYMHVRLIGDSKIVLSVSVSVSVHGCLSRLSLCGPVMSRVYPASRSMTAGIGSSPPATRPTD